MTARDVFEAILIELNKNYGTPDLLLEDFNHYINKSVYQWTQKRYNVYDTNQQTTDDVQVLKMNYEFSAPLDYDNPAENELSFKRKGSNYYFTGKLPNTYFHMLNCILEYTVKTGYKCYPAGSSFSMPAKPLSSDKESLILQNAWLKPSYRNPYFKIESGGWQATAGQGDTPGSKLSVTFGPDANIVRTAGDIAGVFELTKVHCDFIKYPMEIVLTNDQLNTLIDGSQIMEFKEDVCHEIIKEAVVLIAFGNNNPIAQNYSAVNQSVPPQGGIQQQQPQQ